MTTHRISGLDSIRFVCALWVFFGHGHAPPASNPFEINTLLYWVFRGIYGNMWSGPAAVIVFFVISGFCIHYPFANRGDSLPAFAFLVKRWLRLGLPLAVAIPIAQLHGHSLPLFDKTILWSLLAELVYYSIYPFLRKIWKLQGSWLLILTLASVLAFLVVLSAPHAGDYPSYGPWLNWLIGLPCWLMGCLLADWISASKRASITSATLWMWRLAVFAAAGLCSVLRFHSPIGYPWTLDIFAVLVLFWLYREISFRFESPASPMLEWAGRWSYSLYLMHAVAATRFGLIFSDIGSSFSTWFLKVSFVLVACYLFHLLVEWPSHAIARRLGDFFDRSKPIKANKSPRKIEESSVEK